MGIETNTVLEFLNNLWGLGTALQRHNLFPEKELSGLSPNFHIYVTESDSIRYNKLEARQVFSKILMIKSHEWNI